MVLTAFGNLSLLITEEVSWESFREQAPWDQFLFSGLGPFYLVLPVTKHLAILTSILCFK